MTIGTIYRRLASYLTDTRFGLACASLVIISVRMLAACNPIQDPHAAEQVVADYYQAVRAHDFNRVADFYAPSFFEKNPRDKWLARLQSVSTELGDLKDDHLTTWRQDTRAMVGSAQNGTFVTLRSNVTNTKATTIETFVLQKLAGDVGWKIVSQDVQSNTLLSQ